MEGTMKTPKTLNESLEFYKEIMNDELEYEIRFGTIKGKEPITKIQYDNIIKQFISQGFNVSEPEYILRIMCETRSEEGTYSMSDIRTEISGMSQITQYCKSNHIIYDGNLISKMYKKIPFSNNDIPIRPIDVPNYNFRIGMANEIPLHEGDIETKLLIDNWKENKKTFRYMNRYTLTHKDYPLKIDMSIVKSSTNKKGKYKPSYSLQESRVLESSEKYEVEIELLNQDVELEDLIKKVRTSIRIVLSGIQSTNYPISDVEQKDILDEYMRVIWGNSHKGKILPKHFCGPSSSTLHMDNLLEKEGSISVLTNYSVTEKADGDRKLLYISKSGKIYLIDTNMNIQYTGASSDNAESYNSILDGEHILHDSKHNYINLYAAFDVYYINKKNVRGEQFINEHDSRLTLLNYMVKDLDIKSHTFKLECKNFEYQGSIFECCKKVLENKYQYVTDGLIFTPIHLGVGEENGKQSKPLKTSWKHSFKWKPPEYNTIDFLISTKKENGEDVVKHSFQPGTNLEGVALKQYKQIVLCVGFDEKKHGYVNPCLDVFNNSVDFVEDENEEQYHPKRFYPTTPFDENAGLCNVKLENGNDGVLRMMSEEGEVIEDNMIVEFKYNMERVKGWNWEPLRVRYDKTMEYRKGGKNYGNAFHVADSNWHSIHHPIHENILKGEEVITKEEISDEIYYVQQNRNDFMKPLRDFHNLYVKKNLITCVSPPGGTLIDMAVGKGGDIPKWNNTNLRYVFGIDVSKDNIENRMNGVCSRYLNHKKMKEDIYDAMFLQGDTSKNIRNGEAFAVERSKNISDGLMGKGGRNVEIIGQNVHDNYGVGKDGFDVCSIQFALHYMFENKNTLHSFIRNVCENVKMGGYFIGCAYDGNKILKLFKDKKVKENESYAIYEKGSKLWEITRRFSEDVLEPDESSLGMTIEIYQETFQKVFKEYLIHYDYLDRIMENYGFLRLKKDELIKLGLDDSYSFSELFASMRKKARESKEYGAAPKMKGYEKEISFLNKTFIYKKVRSVDIEQIYNSHLSDGSKLLEEVPVEEPVEEPAEEPPVEEEPAEEPAEEPPVEEPAQEEYKGAEEVKEDGFTGYSPIESPKASDMSEFLNTDKPEIIMMMGFPNSGRSEMASKIIENDNYSLVQEKEIAKIKSLSLKEIKLGKSVVIDSTNSNKKKRKEIVDFAKKHKYSITCIHHLKTLEEVLKINDSLPVMEKTPKRTFTLYNKTYEEPTEDEGFTLITL